MGEKIVIEELKLIAAEYGTIACCPFDHSSGCSAKCEYDLSHDFGPSWATKLCADCFNDGIGGKGELVVVPFAKHVIIQHVVGISNGRYLGACDTCGSLPMNVCRICYRQSHILAVICSECIMMYFVCTGQLNLLTYLRKDKTTISRGHDLMMPCSITDCCLGNLGNSGYRQSSLFSVCDQHRMLAIGSVHGLTSTQNKDVYTVRNLKYKPPGEMQISGRKRFESGARQALAMNNLLFTLLEFLPTDIRTITSRTRTILSTQRLHAKHRNSARWNFARANKYREYWGSNFQHESIIILYLMKEPMVP